MANKHDPRRDRRRRHLHRPRLLRDRPRDRRISAIVTAKSDTTPPDFEQGVLNVLAKGGVDREARRLPRARHDGRHQRADRAQGRQDRADHDRGLPRLAGDRARQPAGLLQPPLREAGAVRAALSAPRGAGPLAPRRARAQAARPVRSAGDPRRFPGRRRRGDRDLPAARLRRPCARAGGARRGPRALAGGLGRRLAPDHARVARVRADEHGRLSAYVQPVAERYLSRLRERRAGRRLRRPARTSCSRTAASTRSSGTKEIPITMVESGPASGFWGAAELGRLIGEPNVLALDIGGTTAKCSLIEGGHVKIMTDYWIEREPARRPATRSWCRSSTSSRSATAAAAIAWVDDFGKLHVGPQSAGAVPGPAAYGRGGTRGDDDRRQPRARPHQRATTSAAARSRPTWTPSQPRTRRGRAASSASTADEAARGIVRIANNNMINALKLVSVNRGYDPRDFTLVAFGGGGGMHAVALGRRARHPQGRHPARGATSSRPGGC